MSAAARAGLTVRRAVLRWCFWYTRGLDADIAADRRSEIASDLHEQRAVLQESGKSAWRISVQVADRALRGVPADLMWRAERIRDGEVDRPALNWLRWSESVTALGFAFAFAMVGVGVYVTARVARALAIGDIGYVPSATYQLILLTFVGTAGAVLLIGRRQRRWGAALMVIPSVFLPTIIMELLYVVSATGTALFGARATLWAIVSTALSAGLVVVFTTVFITATVTARRGRRTFRLTERTSA